MTVTILTITPTDCNGYEVAYTYGGEAMPPVRIWWSRDPRDWSIENGKAGPHWSFERALQGAVMNAVMRSGKSPLVCPSWEVTP